MHDSTIIQRPPAGSPYASNPKRNTHANIDISITCLIPNRFRKNGMVRMNKVSDIWEIDIMMVEYFTTNESAYSGNRLKSSRKESPYMLVSCSAAPKNMEKIKNRAIR